ncbi:MAG: B12-binding domain-containing radical SAM protein [Candidatus Omnitrophica bacterium]|nr:B12-binding domain-containing radical SAM protein [Candidatus Omnitrophota bacterium]
MPRLLLINPSIAHKSIGAIRETAWPPLNLPYLAAVTPDHYEIEVIDENVQPFEYREADIVGITALTASVYRAYQLAQVYRNRGIPTIMGGIHVSMMPEEALRFCDAVVIGEGEDIWHKVLEDFEAGSLQKQYRGFWVNLETLPLPRRDILQNPYYRWGNIQTSRGCPMNCSFCSVTAFNGRRFRRRPLDLVIEELEQMPQKWVGLTDDNIIGYGKKDLEWTRTFFSRILDKGIKKLFFAQASILIGEDRSLLRLASRAGLRVVFTGMESVNPNTLQAYRKDINLKSLNQGRYKELISNIRKEKIVFHGAFVLGGDEDDRSVFQSTLQFVKSSHIDVLQMTKPTPLPGTQLWKILQEGGRILDQNFPQAWTEYRLSRLVFRPAQMTIEEVYEGFHYLREIYFSFWETVKRTFYTLLATKNLTSTLIAYKLNASYKKAFRNSENYPLYNRPNLKKKFGS